MSYPAAVLVDNPLHYWRCADPGGALLHDIGSGPQRAMVTTGVAAQLAYTGPASDGGSIWVDSGVAAWHNEGEILATPFSLEVCVWRHLASGLVEVIAEMLGQLQIAAGGTVGFSSRSGFTLGSGSVVTEQAWHHLVGTYGPAGGTKIYFDGALSNSNATYIAVGSAGHIATLGMSSLQANFAHCNIAEFAVYPTELSAAQVLAHYNALDSLATRPVWVGGGTFNSTTGVPTFGGANTAAILAAVRKTF